MPIKNLLELPTFFTWLRKNMIWFFVLLAACGDKNQNEVNTQKSTIVVKNDSTLKQIISISDTFGLNSLSIDSADKLKEPKTKPRRNNHPSDEICHPYYQTILLPNKQLKGAYNSEIGVGNNLVASLAYDNDLMMCGNMTDAWYVQSIAIEFLNFQNLKNRTLIELPNKNLKISTSGNSAWGNSYCTEIGGKIIFHQLNKNFISASVFLIDLKNHGVLFNRRDLPFKITAQKFDAPKVKPYLSNSEVASALAALPPLQPILIDHLLNPPLDSAAKPILMQEMEERNAPDPLDTTVYRIGLDEKARLGGGIAGGLAFYLEQINIKDLNSEVTVNLSYVIEKDGTLSRLKLETKTGALTIDQEAYIRRQVMLRYSRNWKPAKRYFRPVRSLVKEQVKFIPEKDYFSR